jgi:hypothetical protein
MDIYAKARLDDLEKWISHTRADDPFLRSCTAPVSFVDGQVKVKVFLNSHFGGQVFFVISVSDLPNI